MLTAASDIGEKIRTSTVEVLSTTVNRFSVGRVGRGANPEKVENIEHVFYYSVGGGGNEGRNIPNSPSISCCAASE